jgi:dsDNA-specific endonuclease/ATPase MutS2
MEVSNEAILALVEKTSTNSANIENLIEAIHGVIERIEKNSENNRKEIDKILLSMKEFHKQLGSKASLLQHDDHEKRLSALELRVKIKDSWLKTMDWFLRRFRDLFFVCAFIMSCLYVVEKREPIYTFFTSQKQN